MQIILKAKRLDNLLAMSERAKSSLLKIRSSDGEEYEFDDESIEEMAILKTMTMLIDDENFLA